MCFIVYAILKYIAVSTIKYTYIHIYICMEWFFEEIKTRKYASPQKKTPCPGRTCEFVNVRGQSLVSSGKIYDVSWKHWES
jgi:hypothetical protein